LVKLAHPSPRKRKGERQKAKPKLQGASGKNENGGRKFPIKHGIGDCVYPLSTSDKLGSENGVVWEGGHRDREKVRRGKYGQTVATGLPRLKAEGKKLKGTDRIAVQSPPRKKPGSGPRG